MGVMGIFRAGRFWLLAVFLFAAANMAADVAAQSADGEGKTGPLTLTVFYDFFAKGIKVANVADTLTIDNNGEYRINRVAAAVGLAKVLHGDVINGSAGRVFGGILQMSAYHQKRGSRPPQSAAFDGELLQLMRGEESKTATVSAPLFDYLTIIYSHYVAGRVLTGTVRQTDGWRIRDYVYEVGAAEKMETPFGELAVLPVSYRSNRGPRQFWLAPEMGFLPVRSIVEDKGITFETTMVPARQN